MKKKLIVMISIIGIVVVIGIIMLQNKQKNEVIWDEKQNVNQPILLDGIIIQHKKDKHKKEEQANGQMLRH